MTRKHILNSIEFTFKPFKDLENFQKRFQNLEIKKHFENGGKCLYIPLTLQTIGSHVIRKLL